MRIVNFIFNINNNCCCDVEEKQFPVAASDDYIQEKFEEWLSQKMENYELKSFWEEQE